MAISVSFGGATIYNDGGYSTTTVDVGGGFPIGPAGLVAVIGEADAGAPGASEASIRNNRFTADQLSTIRAKYRSGPIVDSSAFLFAPAADAAIPNGAQSIWFYKTNNSTRASLALANTYGTLRAKEWGIGGNRMTTEIISTTEVAPMVTSSAITIFGAALNTKTFDIYVNGVKHVITLSSTPADHADRATLITELNALLIAATAGVTVTAGTLAGTIVLTMNADVTAYQNGYAKSMELIGADLTNLGLTAGTTVSATEASIIVKIKQPRDLMTETSDIGGNVVLSIGCSTGTAATVAVSATSIILTPTPGTAITLLKANYVTLNDIVDTINTLPGWSCALGSTLYGNLSPAALDHISAIGALSPAGMPAMIKKDAAEVQSAVANSAIADLLNPAVKGLPAALTETLLTGGAKGKTTSADIVAALDAFTKFKVNFILPLFSRDALDDIADGLTDSQSTYTIAAVHQAVKTHISLTKTVKKRSERQAVLSIKADYTSCKETSAQPSDGRTQLVIQDCRQADSTGTVKWFQPWALAALLTGGRCGAPIGEPMTFKFLNTSGIRHTPQAMTTPEVDIVLDFDPDTQGEDAVQAGITYMQERSTGGFRVAQDNTTYGVDSNWVWNRANVIYAADICAQNLRQGLEDIYVGKKNTITVADVTGTATSILNALKGQGLTVSTSDAPQGFKNLVIKIVGNTIYVDVVLKLVEGVDFCLVQLVLQRATA